MATTDVNLDLLADSRTISYIKVAFLALLTYDTLLQINEEYLYIWRSRWTLIKGLHLWTRYGTFIGAAVPVIHAALLNGPYPLVCDGVTFFTTMFSVFGIGVTQLILMIRTYTLYERSKLLLAFFALTWVVFLSVTIWAMFKATNLLIFVKNSDNPLACYFAPPTDFNTGLFGYSCLLAVETTIFVLTFLKVYRKFSLKRGTLESMYRDGVWFYFAILPFTIAAIVAIFRAPNRQTGVLNTPLQVMHSILVCRLITHTRAVAAAEDEREAAVSKVFSYHHPNWTRTRTGTETSYASGSSPYALVRQQGSDEVLDISVGAREQMGLAYR